MDFMVTQRRPKQSSMDFMMTQRRPKGDEVYSEGRQRAWTLPVKPVFRKSLLVSSNLDRSSSSHWSPASSPVPSSVADGFLLGFRPALVFAQMFSLLPVSKPSDAQHADFRWKSARTVITAIIIALAIFKSSFSIIRMIETGVKYNTSVNAIFFTMTITAQVLFLRVSSAWRGLVLAVGRVEAVFIRVYGNPHKLRPRMLAVTAAALAMAVVEHAMAIMGTLGYVWPCYQRGGVSLLLQGYFLTKYRKTFTMMTFTAWKAAVVMALQIINHFVWSFLDLFVSLFAMGLSARFHQINIELEAISNEAQTPEFWRRKRALYNVLAELVRQVDLVLGPVILVSYASDLYFICLQTLSIVNPVNVSRFHKVYFSFSLAYIILRTTFMTYVASNLNEESKRPKDVLFDLPSSSYSIEAERFLTQVLTDNVALTGCNFFTISRSFLLTVGGTIVTYVVVLVQFNRGKDANPDAALSNGTVSCTCEDLKIYSC
ncbi:gustatory receptor 5a for trehalose-like [Thrips palmi]|uniref:Gustatory receptor 5a for trehalose-like n=1 Tax=Thrips palmi TaxID=161013 RepID=A0A6P8YPX1_THRPL|nr:gustatory receptor 5a for trehalose-like [Thrips palmi]